LFPEKNAIQLNDTHPAIAIPEFMRILMDEKGRGWDEAWELTQKTFAYTNHTVMPEALEKWSIGLIERLLPRHIQIIYEINGRFLKEVEEKFPGDEELKRRVSLIEEGVNRMVRMAFLAIVGSHTINGVAELHSHLIRETIFADFYKIYPDKFQNKTNGITQRRWLAKSNQSLTALINSKIGNGWIRDLFQIKEIEKFKDDAGFQKDWANVKGKNKELLAQIIKEKTGITVNPDSLFDVQIKRIHEYKRQHMNIFHVISLYNRIQANPERDWTPRTIIFSGKSAPGYYIAKLIIKLIHQTAAVIHSDKSIRDLLKVVFIPDYSVSLAERIIPAADLSEQISTAGTEASGTGNMKFALNGALTIGTLDGANIEIMEEVGKENIFIFGLRTEEVQGLKSKGYNPWTFFEKSKELKSIIQFIEEKLSLDSSRELFKPLLNTLFDGGDPFMVMADMDSYIDTQNQISEFYKNKKEWLRKSIVNSARMGKFSSDRTITEYARDIWKIGAVKINPPHESGYWK
jgi:starch phosphorylase